MHMPRPFKARQCICHCPAGDVKGARQLGRGAFITGVCQMVQYAKMRQLHPLGQHLSDPCTRQLVGHEQLSKQRDG